MKQAITLLITFLFSAFSYAQYIECVGNAALLMHEGNNLLIFEHLGPTAEIRSKIGSTDWYQLPDTTTPITSGTDYLYPEHAQGYMIKNATEREYFWVFDYDSLCPQIEAINASLTCENTTLTLHGILPQMHYVNQHGKAFVYPRTCQIIYLDQQWGDNLWIDSVAVVSSPLQASITIPASPVPTDFAIVDTIATILMLNHDTIRSDFFQPVAIKAHPQAIVTTRPKDKSNEVERPIDPETLISRSAPLEIEFRANALNAEYYRWEIFKGSELFLTRNEAQHKFTFEEPGPYTAKLFMANSHGCELQAEEFPISVSISMLDVPNVFTPNGDGIHDEFRVVYRSLREFHIWVYNRWGHLVYKSDDPAKGWDGNINGRPAAEGAYYYVIRALGTDAEMDYMAKPKYSKKMKKGEMPTGVYQLSGDINLLR